MIENGVHAKILICIFHHQILLNFKEWKAKLNPVELTELNAG